MNQILKTFAFTTLFVGAGVAVACSSDDDTKPAGTGSSSGTSGTSSGGTSGSSGTSGGSSSGDTTFTPPQDPGPGGFLVTVSGEDLATLGYDWTTTSKADGDPPAFVDGWAVKFEHVIVTVDKIRVNADPDKDSANPQTVGAVVASVDGPFAVDATIGGNIPGKSGSADEKTVAIAAIAKQASGDAFDPTARYAFSYDLVAASASAKLVNLDAEGKQLYEDAKAKGYAMVFAGTATYKGAAPEASSVFAKIPKTVKFTLGFKNPSSYINCQNTDLDAVSDDEFPRGIQASAAKSTTAQITIHTDHGFWDKLNIEGTPLHFDPIAANSSTYGTADSTGVVTIDDLVNVDVTGFKTKAGDVLPGRSLVSDYTAPAGQLKFDPNGTSFTKANSYAAYLAYSAASGGHLNADGECEVKNNFTP